MRQPWSASAASPFPGLRPFAYDDHEFFFGRQQQVFALYRLIDRSQFIAVVGSSGSGKSSLVRAGLLPLLDEETRGAGGRKWLWQEMHPADAPLRRLTNMLARLADDDDPAIESARRAVIAGHLQRSSFGIGDALAEIDGIEDQSLVLVIDQFEELFRFATRGTPGRSTSVEEARAQDEATKFVQLLLEASRLSTRKVHIILTMRSDFIGDCSRFHGLPEAICAAQFLVPSPTRDQLDDIIRTPVKEAGGTISPQLVERLLNDCSTELDQLPVLQHCLSRLWKEAGRPTGRSAATAPGADGPPVSRELTLDHYHNIGGFADALSRHANEVLGEGPKDLPLWHVTAEQTFRALSELDKDGRAVRRGLRFSQLLAETGADEKTLRRLLDRFRADDCSFLTPSTLETPVIEDTTRIDVGHEALLRRWDKVSGRDAEIGWLRAEQVAGEKYRALLALAENGKASLPGNMVEDNVSWWNRRPRTPAWAGRYGGGFDRVQRLLRRSQTRRQLWQFTKVATFVTAVALAAWMYRAERKALDAEKAALNAEREVKEHREEVLKATEKSVGQLAAFRSSGAISSEAARELLKISQVSVDIALKSGQRAPETVAVGTGLVLAMSDVHVHLGEKDTAKSLVENAKAIAQEFLAKDPASVRFKRLVYACEFRLADLQSSRDAAEKQYRAALALAQQLAETTSADTDRLKIAFISNKIGDIYEARGMWTDAIRQYEIAGQIAQALADKSPNAIDGPRDVAAAKSRVGQVLSATGDYSGALAKYREAMTILTSLLDKSPDHQSLLSNRAATHRRMGEALRHDKQLDEAQRAYDAAVKDRQQLHERDNANVPWRVGLAMDLSSLGDIRMELKDWDKAAGNYSAALRHRAGLAAREPGNVPWQRAFALAHVSRGNALIARNRPGGDHRRDDVQRALEDHYRAAATILESLEEAKSDPRARLDLFDLYLRIGETLTTHGKQEDTLTAYRSALAVAQRAITSDPRRLWQARLSSTHEKVGDILAAATGDPSEALKQYTEALAVVESAIARQSSDDLLQRKNVLTAKIEALGAKRETNAQ